MPISISVPEDLDFKPKITVIGVGGGGCNAVDHMIESKLEGVSFVACNTDLQALRRSNCPVRVRLGVNSTQGLGAGSNPTVGSEAAEESLDEVLDAVGDTHLLFIVAGFGGGTGTGAVPVIARAARQRGILTVAVVTTPFAFEAVNRTEVAQAGLRELRQAVDTFVVIANQNLFDLQTANMSLLDSFRLVDNVLHDGVRGISDLLMFPGLINLDFADVRSAMKDAGAALMGTGQATGDNRIEEATNAAISNPLLSSRGLEMDQATSLLVNITSSADVSLVQTERIMEIIRERTHERVNLKVGVAINDEMGDAIRVSVVMAGLEGYDSPVPDSMAPLVRDLAPTASPEHPSVPLCSHPAADGQGWLEGTDGPKHGARRGARPDSRPAVAESRPAWSSANREAATVDRAQTGPERAAVAELALEGPEAADGIPGAGSRPRDFGRARGPETGRAGGVMPAVMTQEPPAVAPEEDPRDSGFAREPETNRTEGAMRRAPTQEPRAVAPEAGPRDPAGRNRDDYGRTAVGASGAERFVTGEHQAETDLRDRSSPRPLAARAETEPGLAPSPDRSPEAMPDGTAATVTLRPAVQLNGGGKFRSLSWGKVFRLISGRKKLDAGRREPLLQSPVPTANPMGKGDRPVPATGFGRGSGQGPEAAWGSGEPVSARAVLGIDPQQIPSFRK